MPWYYAGPEAKPVGPFTLEELRARREQGLLHADTFIIEHTGMPGHTPAWRRYHDVFPFAPTLPPVPGTSTAAPLPPPVPPTPTAAPHPLFPSASVPPPAPPPAYPAGIQRDPYLDLKPTNGFCLWGFWLGLISLCLCGFFLIPPILSLILSSIGLIQLAQNPKQSGRALGIWGVILSLIAILFALSFCVYLAWPMLKAHEITVTEQTSNDSE